MSDSECARVLLGISRKAKISDAVNALIEENDEMRKRIAELERDKARLRSRLKAIVEWLEKNESSVFRRGLWDAINQADEALNAALAAMERK